MVPFAKFLLLWCLSAGIGLSYGDGVCTCICSGENSPDHPGIEPGDEEGSGERPDSRAGPLSAAALIAFAKQILAPFTATALTRLHEATFGNGRAGRSIDFAVHNPSNVDWTIDSNKCDQGGWTSSMLPPHKIPPKASEIFGAESTGKGVNCTLKYFDSQRGKWISMRGVNPFAGSNDAFVDAVGVKKSKIVGAGTSNTIRFTFENI